MGATTGHGGWRLERDDAPAPPPDAVRETLARLRGGSGHGRIRCPLCGWRPGKHDRWLCRCGCSWNTFDTRGRCPDCQYQWRHTACYGCGRYSRHEAWYAPGGEDGGDGGAGHGGAGHGG